MTLALTNPDLAHLPAEPELWQVQAIGAACLGRRGPLAVVVEEV